MIPQSPAVAGTRGHLLRESIIEWGRIRAAPRTTPPGMRRMKLRLPCSYRSATIVCAAALCIPSQVRYEAELRSEGKNDDLEDALRVVIRHFLYRREASAVVYIVW
jgi:hypothetical protein